MADARMRELLLERFPLFAGLDGPRLDEFVSVLSVRSVPAGTVLFDAAQPCVMFPLVLEGRVRVCKTTPSGREILLYHVEPGQGCILSSGCLLGQVDYSASAVAETDVTVAGIPSAVFNELLVTYEPFRRHVFGLYGERLAEVMELVEEVAFRKLDSRLARLLIHRGPVIEETHQKLADDLGSVREIVSRLLRSFEHRGWVRLERERVTVVDPAALAKLASDERRESA
jgi:CRP/FNR family transcriptional regulator